MNHCCFEQLCASKVEDRENSQPSSCQTLWPSCCLSVQLKAAQQAGFHAGTSWYHAPRSRLLCVHHLSGPTWLWAGPPGLQGLGHVYEPCWYLPSAPREKYRKSANNEDYMKRTYQWNMSKNIQAGLEKTTQRMSTQDHHIPSPKR